MELNVNSERNKFKTIKIDGKSLLDITFDLVTNSKTQLSKWLSKILNESFPLFVDFTYKFGYQRTKLLSSMKMMIMCWVEQIPTKVSYFQEEGKIIHIEDIQKKSSDINLIQKIMNLMNQFIRWKSFKKKHNNFIKINSNINNSFFSREKNKWFTLSWKCKDMNTMLKSRTYHLFFKKRWIIVMWFLWDR